MKTKYVARDPSRESARGADAPAHGVVMGSRDPRRGRRSQIVARGARSPPLARARRPERSATRAPAARTRLDAYEAGGPSSEAGGASALVTPRAARGNRAPGPSPEPSRTGWSVDAVVHSRARHIEPGAGCREDREWRNTEAQARRERRRERAGRVGYGRGAPLVEGVRRREAVEAALVLRADVDRRLRRLEHGCGRERRRAAIVAERRRRARRHHDQPRSERGGDGEHETDQATRHAPTMDGEPRTRKGAPHPPRPRYRKLPFAIQSFTSASSARSGMLVAMGGIWSPSSFRFPSR